MSPADAARYRQIAETLRGRIESGELPPGFTLPGELTLADEFGVARGTVQKALEALRADGLIETIVGRGTQVRARRSPRSLGPERYTHGWNDGVAALTVDRTGASTEQAIALDLATGDELLRQRFVHELDGRPWRLTTSYIPLLRIRGTDLAKGHALHAEPIEQLAAAGVHVDEIWESPSCRPATDDEAKALQAPAGSRVTAITRWMSAGGLRVETADIVMPADQARLVYRLTQ